ncbi:NYN domain-containing protein [Rhodobacter ferrooxidans]|uniref:NYN domain-containing protein n=1 Tax=Rhodobacter ferrooxidans TaxID=371731 RepID=C8RWK3_9RHOB|nr:NYN domain-containing protein [Rhodobacter sp. SW2]EEW26946.1 protein of unknown function DUF88 [Rhodobacter sp. SW2]
MKPEIGGFEAAGNAKTQRVAVMIDGENLSAGLAGQIITKSLAFGRLTIKRVYGNAIRLTQWEAAPGFRLIHSGNGKNATDLLLCIEAMELVHSGLVDTLVIASSDRDFSHLAAHLCEKGQQVIGMGEAKASDAFRKACTRFIELGMNSKPLEASAITIVSSPAAPVVAKPIAAKLSKIDAFLHDLMERVGIDGWLSIRQINHAAQKADVRIGSQPERTWRAYLTKHTALYEYKTEGSEPLVRLLHP